MHQHADATHPLRLLCARCKRPDRHCTAEKRYELAPSHWLPRGLGQSHRIKLNQHTEIGPHVRFWSKADICSAKRHVRFTPESGHVRCTSECRLRAKSGHWKL